MVSRSSGVDQRDHISQGWEGRRASGLLGIMPGILEHMLSASCSREDLDESYRLLDHPEKYENGFIVRVSSHRSNNCARGECVRERERKSIVINLSPLTDRQNTREKEPAR